MSRFHGDALSGVGVGNGSGVWGGVAMGDGEGVEPPALPRSGAEQPAPVTNTAVATSQTKGRITSQVCV